MAYNGPAYPVYGGPIGVIPVYGTGIPSGKPAQRTIDMRSLDFGAAGPIPPYPVYQFSGKKDYWEYDLHNPFAHVPPYY